MLATCVVQVDSRTDCEEVARTTENQGSTTQAVVPETEIVCATTSPTPMISE